MLTEITNEASALAGGAPITLVSNFYFQVVSSFVLSVVAALVTDRIVEPRLGVYEATQAEVGEAPALDAAGEARGMRFAGLTILAYVVFILLLTLPSGAPLRDPQTGDIIGATPFMEMCIRDSASPRRGACATPARPSGRPVTRWCSSPTAA